MTALAGAARRRIAVLIGVGLVVASICNGALFYLKRTGVIDNASYQAYWSVHCGSEIGLAPWTVTASCPCDEARAPMERTPETNPTERSKTRYLYRSDGYGVALKAFKDILAVGFILLSLHLRGRQISSFPAIGTAWPLVVLASIVLFGFANSYAGYGGEIAWAGLRPYLFLAMALTGGWIAGEMAIFARCIALLLGFELLLMPFEFAFGMHIHGHFDDTSLVRRLSGTLVAPNSFGIFVVAALAFYRAFSSDRKYLPHVVAATLILVVASGSATAWLALLLVLSAISIGKFKRVHPVVVSLAAILLCVTLLLWLPALVGRTDVFDSVFGPGARLDEITSAIRSVGTVELLLGGGIGIGTNTLATLFGTALPSPWDPSGASAGAESTVVALIRQSGLLGLLAFYSVLAWGFWRDPRARLFYLVIALSSLTAKVTELFPVNFLLGLALAHSAADPARAPKIGAADDSGQQYRK